MCVLCADLCVSVIELLASEWVVFFSFGENEVFVKIRVEYWQKRFSTTIKQMMGVGGKTRHVKDEQLRKTENMEIYKVYTVADVCNCTKSLPFTVA